MQEAGNTVSDITGIVPYFFMLDDTVESGMARLERDYPHLELKLVGEAHMVGSELSVTGSWEDVLRWVIAEYEGADADIVLDLLRDFKLVG